MHSVADLAERFLDDPAVSWAVGCFGAVAEFHRDPGETFERTGPLSIRTGRGAIEIHADALADARPLAWEASVGHGNPWNQGFALCLPERDAAMSGRTAFARVGDAPDGAVFDLGVGAPHVDACVLVADDALARDLDADCGRSLWDPESNAYERIKRAAPPRIFRSHLATVRVDQIIGSRADDVPTPEGPHTHVIRGILTKKTVHAYSNEIPVPAGHLPCLYAYPAHPVRDDLGRPRLFDARAFEAFQGLLRDYGPDGFAAHKAALLAHARGVGDRPDDVDRMTAGIALAQLEAQGLGADRAAKLADAWDVRR